MSKSFGAVELEPARCVALLATAGVGRVVFTNRAMPVVRPVRFALHDGAVWFRMSAGDMWFARALDTVVAFAVDDVSADLDAGWFVTVVGRASEVRNGPLISELAELLPAVGYHNEDRFVRILVESVSGHRIRPAVRRCACDAG
ncbi:MAG TPA: pyridoxamine 5'-phosphate oxidase family protein [Pseudonocardiaceae bacterium]